MGRTSTSLCFPDFTTVIMRIIQQIRERASKTQKTIVLPRSTDIRVLKAAHELSSKDYCDIVLIGEKDNIESLLRSENEPPLHDAVRIVSTSDSDRIEKFAQNLYARRKHKGLSFDQAKEMVQDLLYFGASMVATGEADGCVAGSVSTTGDVLRAAIHVIGLKPGSSVVSSTFLMSFEDGRNFTYADGAVVPYPTSDQLSTIAYDSAQTHRALTGVEPKVAMLSFSSKGSADHPSVELVQEAYQILLQKEPDFDVDGELQFDAAYVPGVGQRKAPGSAVAGNANVFIFPNLDAGNISYKITERLAHATATGPIVQGLAKPMMDLSRGCEWDDIVNTVCVCCLM